MKILIAYYSRTGTTKKVAESLKEKLGLEVDLEEIQDIVNRDGVKGYMLAGRDAMQKRLTKLLPIKSLPENYDLVIIGTPSWAWTMSVPVRAYITEQKEKFKDVAFFCTMGGSGDEKTFLEMEKIIGKKPKATLALKTVEVVKNEFENRVADFAEKIKI